MRNLILLAFVFLAFTGANSAKAFDAERGDTAIRVVIQENGTHFSLERCDSPTSEECTPVSNETYPLRALDQQIQNLEKMSKVKHGGLIFVTVAGTAIGTTYTVMLTVRRLSAYPYGYNILTRLVTGEFVAESIIKLGDWVSSKLPEKIDYLIMASGIGAAFGATFAHWGSLIYFLGRAIPFADHRIPQAQAELLEKLKSGEPVKFTEGELGDLVDELRAAGLAPRY